MLVNCRRNFQFCSNSRLDSFLFLLEIILLFCPVVISNDAQFDINYASFDDYWMKEMNVIEGELCRCWMEIELEMFKM